LLLLLLVVVCRRTIPMSARHGSRLVFRQGSPLLPPDLSAVAASHARATIIVCDKSRTRDEGDAQSLRCVVTGLPLLSWLVEGMGEAGVLCIGVVE
jgi:hypothetical protein